MELLRTSAEQRIPRSARPALSRGNQAEARRDATALPYCVWHTTRVYARLPQGTAPAEPISTHESSWGLQTTAAICVAPVRSASGNRRDVSGCWLRDVLGRTPPTSLVRRYRRRRSRGADADGTVVSDANAGPVDVVTPPSPDAAAPVDAASPDDAATPDWPPACPATNDQDGDGVGEAWTIAPPTSTLTRPTSWRRTPAWPPMGWATCATRDPPRASTPCRSSTDLQLHVGLRPGRPSVPPSPSPASNLSSMIPARTTVRSLQRGMGTDVLVDTRFTFIAWGIDGDADVNKNRSSASRRFQERRLRAMRGTSGQHRQQRHQRGRFRVRRRRRARHHGPHRPRPRDHLPVDDDGVGSLSNISKRQDDAGAHPQRLPSDSPSRPRSPVPDDRRVPARLAVTNPPSRWPDLGSKSRFAISSWRSAGEAPSVAILPRQGQGRHGSALKVLGIASMGELMSRLSERLVSGPETTAFVALLAMSGAGCGHGNSHPDPPRPSQRGARPHRRVAGRHTVGRLLRRHDGRRRYAPRGREQTRCLRQVRRDAQRLREVSSGQKTNFSGHAQRPGGGAKSRADHGRQHHLRFRSPARQGRPRIWHASYLDGEPVEPGQMLKGLRPGQHDLAIEVYVNPQPGQGLTPARLDVHQPVFLTPMLVGRKLSSGERRCRSATAVAREPCGAPRVQQPADRLRQRRHVAPKSRVRTLAHRHHQDLYRPRLPPDWELRPGVKLWGLFKVCAEKTGVVTHVKVIKSADQLVDTKRMTLIRTWRYRPYEDSGVAQGFCYPLRLQSETLQWAEPR